MKYLILCEGPNEKKIIDMLLENKKLKVSEDDLLGRITYHAHKKDEHYLVEILKSKTDKEEKTDETV